jgi:hypothetical protein
MAASVDGYGAQRVDLFVQRKSADDHTAGKHSGPTPNRCGAACVCLGKT